MPNEHTIAENLQRLIDAKTAIGNAITAKGGTVAQGDGLEEFPTAINGISTGVDTSNDTVTAATLKSGYTAHNAAGQQVTGTMLSQPTTVTAETLADGITAYNAAGELITGSAVPLTSWEQLQQKVRNNNMSGISMGDQYACLNGGDAIVWDVIGKNKDTPANPNLSHTLTLRVHNLLSDDFAFDEPEAFYACQSEALSAGMYYYKTDGKNYKFTLTQSVPVGGQLVCTDNSILCSYASGSSTTPIDRVNVYSGLGGTSLGTLNYNTRSGNLNANGRRQFGSNDWKDSDIRQWLNSDKPAGQWWEPQNPWDRPPAYAETMNGFMYDLDPEFLGVIGKTQVTTNYFDTTTGAINGTYITEDYFFLMSASQVSSSYSGEGAKYTPYSDNASRIMYQNGSAYSYFLRSPTSSNSNYVYYVASSGAIGSLVANHSYGVAVVCNII